MLVWTDLETSGLKPTRSALLEVASIVTDDSLNEVARFQRVIYFEHAAAIVEWTESPDHTNFRSPNNFGTEVGVHPFVLEMHTKNGLWKECVYGQALATVYRDFQKFIDENARQTVVQDELKRTELPQLAGSTISFDRSFLAYYMSDVVDKSLHYRNVDISSFNETAKRFWPELFVSRPGSGGDESKKAHRGMADIEESIAVYKHYLANLMPAPVTP